MRVDAGEIRTHGGPSIAHDGTQVSLVMSPIDQTLAQLPTRLETDLPTQIAKRGKRIRPGPAIPMRVSCWWLLGQSIHHRSLQWNHQHGWGLFRLGLPDSPNPHAC